MEANIRELIAQGSRLGIMGGTFDPVHYGHMVAAETARIEFGLDKVLFIPTGIPPHKENRLITDANLRYEMVEMSIRSNKHFMVSRMEIDREGPTYTVDTLRVLADLFPALELLFITGTDALKEMLTWWKHEEIISLAKIIGVSRPGYDSENLIENITQIYPSAQNRIVHIEIPALAISSTDIRMRVEDGKPIRYLLPDEVRLFIKNNALYQREYI